MESSRARPSCDACKRHGQECPTSETDLHLTEGLILAVGNPLLDISARVGNDLLQKYNLGSNDAIMAEDKHMPLYKELMDNYTVEFIAGGSSQNSMRIAQWMLKKPNVCTYFGCVGDDDYARILKEAAISSGVNIRYQVTKEAPTGKCAVLITEMQRSLVADLAAAQKFTIDHLTTEDSKRWVEAAKFFYASGFFIAVSADSVMQLAKHALDNGHTFIINLSAPFVMQFYKEALAEIVEYSDVIMGNDMEAEAFAKAFELTGSVQEIGLKMAQLPKKGSKPRTVIVTQGANDVILVQNGKINLVPVPVLPKEQIIDTNGAGDAFAGGFLSQMVQYKPFETCIECGIYCAREILQQSGCTATGESQFVPSS